MSDPNPADRSNRIPVTEATVEFRPDGTLRYTFREGSRDRSEPPSLKEIMAALAPHFRRRRWTAEQHAAVLEVLAACGWPRERQMAVIQQGMRRPLWPE